MDPAAVLLCVLAQGTNLVVNPDFIDSQSGWAALWTRDPSVGTTRFVDGRAGKRALEVRHDGTQDWAWSQTDTLAVKPGQIYRIEGWLKAQELTSAELSVVTRSASGEALDWSFGAIRTAGTHDWKRLSRRFVIPKNCATIQFRLIGSGKGVVLLSEPSLALTGTKQTPAQAATTLSNPGTTLTLQNDGSISLKPKTGDRVWRTRPLNDDFLIESITRTDALHAIAKVWSMSEDAKLELAVTLAPNEAEATFTVSGDVSMDDNLDLPGGIVTKPGQWLIVPMNEGIMFPTDDTTVEPVSLVTYGGHGICMPWFGVVDPKTGAGVMTTYDTPDDASMAMDRSDGLLRIQPRWEPSRGTLRYARKLTLRAFDKGGYVAMAKAYRAAAKQLGLFKTLAEKRKASPYVDRLIGAVNVWNWDMDKVALCKEMHTMGIEHVLWSGSGSADEIRAINDLGYLSSRYDIYQDVWDPKNKLVWQPSAGWPDDLVLLQNGDWMKGWAHPDKQPDGTTRWYQGGVICSKPALERAKKAIPEELAKIPYHCRFIDTTTASPWRECYNPAHPLSRSDDRKYKMGLLEFCQKQGLVVGTETGIDPSVPFVHYYEGMLSLGPYRLPDAGTDMIAYRKPTPDFLKYQVGSFYRLPLWELVYHDCTVAQWYWGDASNKAPEVWDRRDLLNILYGTAPLLMFDKARWERDKTRMLKTYNDVCKWIRKVGYDEMVSHDFLTADHTVQRTTWSSGRTATVNFGDRPYMAIPPMGFALK